ncbi:MAG: hypothetical protein ACQESB_04605 [Elusimicrobiota bacterium]
MIKGLVFLFILAFLYWVLFYLGSGADGVEKENSYLFNESPAGAVAFQVSDNSGVK